MAVLTSRALSSTFPASQFSDVGQRYADGAGCTYQHGVAREKELNLLIYFPPSAVEIRFRTIMNFVDVQPQSFLDYAWTLPSPAATRAAKPSRTSRKQNRCCDQCRKGKRACDAAILEDVLLDENNSGGSPTVFHYSGKLHFDGALDWPTIDRLDNYGPMASCGNCEKTKKNCTFEWLRSQRISQATQPQPSSTSPAKRRRTQSGSSGATRAESDHVRRADSARPSKHLNATSLKNYTAQPNHLDSSVTFADFPCGDSILNVGSMTMFSSAHSVQSNECLLDLGAGVSNSHRVFANDHAPPSCDFGKGFSRKISSKDITDRADSNPSCTSHGSGVAGRADSSNPKIDGPLMHISRKRRRSPRPNLNSAPPCLATSIDYELLLSANKTPFDGRFTEDIS